MKIRCKKCGDNKESDQFYKNTKKLNGLESHCKSCVLTRKAKRYKAISKAKLKTKQLRLHKNVHVIDVEECTFQEVLINRPCSKNEYNFFKELINGVLCYQNMEKFKGLATAA